MYKLREIEKEIEFLKGFIEEMAKDLKELKERVKRLEVKVYGRDKDRG